MPVACEWVERVRFIAVRLSKQALSNNPRNEDPREDPPVPFIGEERESTPKDNPW